MPSIPVPAVQRQQRPKGAVSMELLGQDAQLYAYPRSVRSVGYGSSPRGQLTTRPAALCCGLRSSTVLTCGWSPQERPLRPY